MARSVNVQAMDYALNALELGRDRTEIRHTLQYLYDMATRTAQVYVKRAIEFRAIQQTVSFASWHRESVPLFLPDGSIIFRSVRVPVYSNDIATSVQRRVNEAREAMQERIDSGDSPGARQHI